METKCKQCTPTYDHVIELWTCDKCYEQIERWRQINNSIYEVSDFGRVRNIKTGTVRKPRPTRSKKQMDNGAKQYHTFHYGKGATHKQFRIHKLVALAFVANPENKPEIDHIDGNSTNNRADNLRWCTHDENMQWRKEANAKSITKV